MGFLNNTTVTVDAILTKKGRELLAQGTEAFNITKFALADDEVDYNLFDVTHPNGSDSYGKVIENMPLLEAIPDENHVMRYKLITLPKNTAKMPVITASVDSITFGASAGLSQPAQIISAVTANVADSSYTFILHDRTVVDMSVTAAASSTSGATTPFFLGEDDAPNSQTEIANEVQIKVKKLGSAKSTQLTIIGNDTGATASVTIQNNLINLASQ